VRRSPDLLAILLALVVATLTMPAALAQLAVEPKPIPAPAIPPPPQLGPAPKINDATPAKPPHLQVDIPAAAELTTVALPPMHEMTKPDKNDKTPPPSDTGAPPAASPGAARSAIQSMAYLVEPGSSSLTNAAQAKLRDVAESMKSDALARVEIRAYTPETAQTESKARRLSLARALAIRDYLVRNGVADDRIDSRALGAVPSETNPDRIELYVER
jgi:outer membrane protein OmpA-like peptidoglycan-associated protein